MLQSDSPETKNSYVLPRGSEENPPMGMFDAGIRMSIEDQVQSPDNLPSDH